MAKAYQYDAGGYYAGEVEDYGLLPNNATRTAPDLQAGHIPHWSGAAWEQVENHKDQEGYVNGERVTIKEYGPLPAGWSDTPPPPTQEEARAAKLAEVMSGYNAAFAPVEHVYPAAEREGWAIQEAEARALLADPVADTPVLTALVQLRAQGESVADLAARVLTNAATWRQIYAWYTGQQQRMFAEVSVLSDMEAIQAYQVVYAVPPAQG